MTPLANGLAEIVSANRFEGSRNEACWSIACDIADLLAIYDDEREKFLNLCGVPESERR